MQSDEEEEEEEVIYVDEDGNPVDPEEGEIVEEEVIYVDEFGNPVEIDDEDEVTSLPKEQKNHKSDKLRETNSDKQKKNHLNMQETAIQAKVQEVVEQLNQRRKKDSKKYKGLPSYLKKTKSHQQHAKSLPEPPETKSQKPIKKMSLSGNSEFEQKIDIQESQQLWEAHAKKRQELRKMAYQNMQIKKGQILDQEVLHYISY